MYIKLDKLKMELDVRVGVLENYKPSKEIKLLHKKVKELNQKIIKFQEETVNPNLAEIEELIKNHNDKFITKE